MRCSRVMRSWAVRATGSGGRVWLIAEIHTVVSLLLEFAGGQLRAVRGGALAARLLCSAVLRSPSPQRVPRVSRARARLAGSSAVLVGRDAARRAIRESVVAAPAEAIIAAEQLAGDTVGHAGLAFA